MKSDLCSVLAAWVKSTWLTTPSCAPTGALKLLPAELTQNKDRLARFEREAYAASSLNHPNIMTIHEIGEEGGHHFIASEYIEGESLRQHLRRSGLDLR